jgi:hypothetical protein
MQPEHGSVGGYENNAQGCALQPADQSRTACSLKSKDWKLVIGNEGRIQKFDPDAAFLIQAGVERNKMAGKLVYIECLKSQVYFFHEAVA